MTCHQFRAWWRQQVPKLMSPVPTMDYLMANSHIDEEKVKSNLIAPLEQFPVQWQTPPRNLRNWTNLTILPQSAGSSFKMGEATYSCRDCGHDRTCVLCVDCFKQSEHRHHRYKMSVSCGGGCCDCGDGEAWKTHPHCATHILGTQIEARDPLSKLNPEIQVRARHAITAVVKYIFEMLTTDTHLRLPSDLTYKGTQK